MHHTILGRQRTSPQVSQPSRHSDPMFPTNINCLHYLGLFCSITHQFHRVKFMHPTSLTTIQVHHINKSISNCLGAGTPLPWLEPMMLHSIYHSESSPYFLCHPTQSSPGARALDKITNHIRLCNQLLKDLIAKTITITIIATNEQMVYHEGCWPKERLRHDKRKGFS